MTLANLRQSVSDWIFRARVPEVAPVTLVQRRIFILPTRQGYVFAFTLMLLLIASINYTLSLGFLLTFLLAAMGGVAMLHTWRNLAHLKLRPGRSDPVFAGEMARFGVSVETPSRARFAVAMRRRGDEAEVVDVETGNLAGVHLTVPARRRGRLDCGRVEIFTRYPVGFFHAWSYFDFGQSVIVYPRPDPLAGLPPMHSRNESEEGIPIPGDDEFNLLRPYRPGDPPRQIAWKALARGQDLLTKEFNATASSELWLDWEQTRANDAEARLSALAHWVMESERLGQSYGLRLPGTSIAPGRGDAHRAHCLEALALFGDPRPQ
ncbi:DUF58 domain-containing protein [Usitatibacter palustris]|uniref:Uncharacterized protein n=1 Tax=Usitatibacter palustris TaxID=2732487 RepID=A0A6M4H6Z8_9PROT|nr:DUF58 domain-containing protein [Usitatibacter palustris]QJR15401.1 hypothetical protein DSM104440_02220 [Usitatibacter palustris]